MGFRNERTVCYGGGRNIRRSMLYGILPLLMMISIYGSAQDCWAIQRHTLMPGGGIETRPDMEKEISSEPGHTAAQIRSTAAVAPGHEATPQLPQESHPQQAPAHGSGSALGEGGDHGPTVTSPKGAESAKLPGRNDHGAAGGHGEPEGSHGAHGPALPEISPIPGVTFVETMIKLLDQELNGRSLGWRPNDIILGRFTDNVNNYQLGVLEALRFTTLRLKDSLTRMGDADSYDPDLEQALNLLMNRSTLFWFPSAENAYGEALEHLRKFSLKLQRGERNFYYRKDNLQALLNSYKDMLGNINKTLVVPCGWFQADDHFYYATGVAHVYYEILRVVRVGFEAPLSSTLHGRDIMDEVIHELYRVEEMRPWIILNGDLDGLTANHRANLNGPLSEVAHLLGILSQF